MAVDPKKLFEWARRMARSHDQDVASFADMVERYIEIHDPDAVTPDHHLPELPAA